jgi:hypothetical protein
MASVEHETTKFAKQICLFHHQRRPGAGLFSLSGVCVSLDVHRRFKEKKQSLTNSALAF